MNSRTAYALVLALAALLLLVRSDSVPLLDPDEARFARTSVEMLRSGDLVVPTFEGQPRLVKPPLVHWIQSWLFSLAGPGEWVVRLHAACATFGSLLLVGWIGRRRCDCRAEFYSQRRKGSRLAGEIVRSYHGRRRRRWKVGLDKTACRKTRFA